MFLQVGFNEEGVYDASDYRTIYTLVGNTKQRGVGDLFKRGLMAAFMLRILELTPFFFNGGSDPRNVKLQVDKLKANQISKLSKPLTCTDHHLSIYLKNIPTPLCVVRFKISESQKFVI